MSVFFVFAIGGCGMMSGTTEIDPLENYTISENAKSAYGDSFNEYYSPEEYVKLISELAVVTNEESIEPVYAINDKLFFVKRTIETYDEFEEAIAIVDVNGNFVTGWNIKWDDYYIKYNSKCGDYFFVRTETGLYSTDLYDIVNQEGQVIANVSGTGYWVDLDKHCVLFPQGNGSAYIVNSKGDVCELQQKSVGFNFGLYCDGFEIGKLNDGVFSVYKEGINHTIAYYYNEKGEAVIDLCDNAVPYKITKLYDFSAGKARIEFIGVAGGAYYGYIDKTGSFVDEPQQMK